MTAETAIYLCEAIALAAAIAVLFSHSVFKSVIFFLTASLAVAALFAVQGATYLFISQLALYGGGIAVLMLFAVVIAGDYEPVSAKRASIAGFIPPVALLAFLCTRVLTNNHAPGASPEMTATVTAKALSGPFLAAFEFSGVLLVVALIASIMIAVQKKDPA